MTDVADAIDDAVATIDHRERDLDELARLRGIEYDLARTAKAKELGVRKSTLDKEVAERREQAPEAGAGRSLEWPRIDLWPEHVGGSELLSELVATFRRYVVLPPSCDATLALWTIHAHAFDASPVTPRLAITSPEKRCGKTTTLEVVQALVPRPILASNITAAAVFRTIEVARPTLLIDEADTFLAEAEELRGVLNSGHRSTGEVIRTAGEDYEPRRFSTWAPVAIAAIGKIPGTLDDRSVKVELRRRGVGEQVERWRADRAHHLADLVRRCARWAADHLEDLRAADPDVPEQLHDRAADNWRPLLAIADQAGGEWPARARVAAVTLSAGAAAEGRREMLLADIRTVFVERGDPDWIATAEIIKSLVEMTERPWSESSKGKPINPSALRSLLEPFKIFSSHNREKTHRGYTRETFNEAWSRYLPSPQLSEPTRPPVQKSAAARDLGLERPVPSQSLADGSYNGRKPHKSSVSDGWTGRKDEARGAEELRI